MTKMMSSGVKFISSILIFFSVLYLFNLVIFAAPKSRESLLEQENEAIRLSKIWKVDSIKSAIAQFEQTAAGWEENNDFSKSVFCLNETAKLSQITSDYKTAFRNLDKAVKLATEHNLIAEETISLSLYALISRQKGDSENSQKFSEDALKISQTIESPLARAYSLLGAGMHSFYYGKIDKTIEFFEKADSYAQQTTDTELITQVLLYVGYSHGRADNSITGLKSMQLALLKSEESGYQRGKALAYFGLGFLNMLLNEKQKAIGFYQKAEEIFPEDFEWLERAKLYSNFGVVCEDYGEFELAKIYREKAYLFYQKADYPFGEMAALRSLANLKFMKGDFDGARKTYSQTIELAKEIKNNFYLALNKEGIGNLELNAGNYDSAIKQYREALEEYKNIGVKFPRVENNLGKAFEKKGDFAAAKAFYTKALELNTQTKDKLSASENLFNLAKLNLLQGNVETSFEQINKSIEITETLYSDVINTNLKRSYFSTVYDRYEFYIHLLMQKHKESPDKNFNLEALQMSEKSRSRSILETLRLAEANLTKDANPELVAREKEVRRLLNENADKLTELLIKNTGNSEISRIESEIVSLENELEEIKVKFKETSPVYSSIKNPTTFDIVQFQQNVLDEETLLLEFSLGEKESYLWIVSKNDFSHVVLPPRKVIESSIEKIRQTFDARQILPNEDVAVYQERLAGLENTFNQEAQLLSNNLLGQIAGKLGKKRLIIVPDGKLTLLPLSALPLPNSDELLINNNEIVYEPSATFFNFLAKTETKTKIPTKDLLIFADPVFSENDNRLLAKDKDNNNLPPVLGLNLRDFRLLDGNGNIPRLFGTQQEADSIASIVGQSQTTIASGFTANRERVLSSDITDFRILHFATHGLIDVERPQVSSIVLSQFDENGQKREGFLRLQDIYALSLTSDLIVLSACQSGIGKEIKGEGLMSLNNAFLQAGAKTVMSSAWKVDDDATAELMKSFYENLIEKRLKPAESLRLAQIKMSKSTQFKSPFYWAAFTVHGEFRHTISASSNYTYHILLGLLVLIGFGVFWHLRVSRFF